MILEPGKNCWRLTKATQAKVLIDGEAYFAEFRKAVMNARDRVLIVGWDIDSRMDLLKSDPDDGYPAALGEFFLEVLKKNKRLHIYILLWDFAMIYALDRDWSPVLNHTNWRRHKRMHLILDGNHKMGASHHQKIVTIDESLTFVGGFDLSKERWDTTKHDPHDERRVNASGDSYMPFHDMQFKLSGPVVKDMNDLIDERWQNASKKPLPKKSLVTDEKLFDSSDKDVFENVSLAIARTGYLVHSDQHIRESEQLHIEAIRSAESLIYIENQYLSSSVIGDELQKKLQQKDGPEIIIVLPKECSGWLEKQTMDVLRARLLELLKKADTHNRLRIYYPRIDAKDEWVISVHAKLFIVDDAFLKIGSSNLSNRSMSLDSECDILLFADGESSVTDKIKNVRFQLLSEHLDCDIDAFARSEQESGSMIESIESFNNGDHCLQVLEHKVEQLIDDIDTLKIADPEHPVEPEYLIDHFIGDTVQKDSSKHLKKFLFLILGLAAIAVLWTLTPVGEWIDKQAIASLLDSWNDTHPLLGKIYFVAGFTILAMLGAPVTVLIGSAGILFGSVTGSFLTASACLLSAIGSYFVGNLTGRNFVRNLSGDKINKVSKRLSQRGIWTVTLVRIVPVAPFAIINMLAGAIQIRLRDFVIGTFIGMLPGILLLTTFFSQFIQFFKDIDLSDGSFLSISIWIVLLIMIIVLIVLIFRKKRS